MSSEAAEPSLRRRSLLFGTAGAAAGAAGAGAAERAESGLAPWQKPAAEPKLVATNSGMPVEKTAAAHPDLILAGDDYQLTDDYAKLSRLAPTLSYRRGVGKDP